MRDRFRMHWYLDSRASLNGGRPLFARTAEKALSEAAALWRDGAYRAAAGYVVVDTDDGMVLCRQERQLMQSAPP